jgi:hypothetical protein
MMFFFLFFLAVPMPASRPPAPAEIRGIVQDLAHQLVPGAAIHVRRRQPETECTIFSAEDGSFSAKKLIPGTYEVFAAKKGYPKSPLAKFELLPEQSFEVDLTLGAPSLRNGFFQRIAHAYITDWKNKQK